MVKDEWKAAARANRKREWRESRRHDRAIVRAQRHCFWRWPLGHEYAALLDPDTNEFAPARCVSCGKRPSGHHHRHVR